jgi:patatin-like phospholipase/acyl hydrolase
MSYPQSEGDLASTKPLIKDVREMNHMPRILALDGGGVRGLSSLLILQQLMKEIEELKRDGKPALPCEYFDLICGTSTGGLIAIMLGRLRMVFDS